ncbi:MAG: STAS domain-containing protein [Candidatus Latescibacterota bacterium]
MAGERISVVRVRDTLLVSVPSDPDDGTVAALQDEVLRAMERHEARGVVMDISTVETLDSFFARTIAETADMISLMGGRTVIAGMRPSVAITITQLGLTLGRPQTALDVDRALDLLEERTPEAADGPERR